MTDASPVRIGVIGAGAFGTLLAARLRESGADVTLIAHAPTDAQTIARDGIALIDAQGARTVRVACVSGDEPAAADDVLIVCVKAYDTRAAAEMHQNRLRPNGFVVTLQNGAGNVEALAEVFGKERIVAGISTEAALLKGVGRVRQTGVGETHVGELDGSTTPRLTRLVEAFHRAGYRTSVADSVDRLIWRKLAINAGINALTAITRQSNGWIAENPHARALAIEAVREVCAVGVRAGCPLDADEMANLMLDVAVRTAANRSSMLTDVERGRITEIEAIAGYVVKTGESFGVPTPVNRVLRDLVLAVSVSRSPKPHVGDSNS